MVSGIYCTISHFIRNDFNFQASTSISRTLSLFLPTLHVWVVAKLAPIASYRKMLDFLQSGSLAIWDKRLSLGWSML